MFSFLFRKKPASLLDSFIVAAYGEATPPKRANVAMAAQLAHRDLLMGLIEMPDVVTVAVDLNDGPIPYSTHDLALSVALSFFRRPEHKAELKAALISARICSLEWYSERKVVRLLFESFEAVLCKQCEC